MTAAATLLDDGADDVLRVRTCVKFDPPKNNPQPTGEPAVPSVLLLAHPSELPERYREEHRHRAVPDYAHGHRRERGKPGGSTGLIRASRPVSDDIICRHRRQTKTKGELLLRTPHTGVVSVTRMCCISSVFSDNLIGLITRLLWHFQVQASF